MEEINIFKQIESLEESSEEILGDSHIQSNLIKEQYKKELESFIQSLNQEKDSYKEKLNLEIKEEEIKLKSKYGADYEEYLSKLTIKFQSNLKQVIQLFDENCLK